MKEIVRLIFVLTIICVVAALVLSQVYNFTKEPIERALREEKLRAIRKVLPEYDNEPDRDVVHIPVGIDETGAEIEKGYYIAFKDEEIVGVAFETSSGEGYSGAIKLMVGVDPNGNITGVEVIHHAETPGLGSKITGDNFLLMVKEKKDGARRNLNNTNWNVKKDGGEIDQITGATISSRAVVEAISDGLLTFSEFKNEIITGSVPLIDTDDN